MRLLRILAVVLSLCSKLIATPLDDARELVKQKQYPAARAALEKILAAEPANAAARHELGLVIRLRGDTPAYEEAAHWLGKAVELEPNNPIFLGDLGGTLLQLASRTTSFSAAT